VQPGDVLHILHVIAPPKQTAMAPDFSPDVLGEDIQARCEIVSDSLATSVLSTEAVVFCPIITLMMRL
jgi:hypothetical protein